MNLKKLSQPDRVSLFRVFLGFVDVGSKSFPQARLFKDIVDGIQSYIGSLLNSPPSVPLRRVPHQNSMPTARRLGLCRTFGRGLVVTPTLNEKFHLKPGNTLDCNVAFQVKNLFNTDPE